MGLHGMGLKVRYYFNGYCDGVTGPPYAGGTSFGLGAAFGMNFHGYPWWDALTGEVKDTVEVLVSTDGKD